MGGRSMPFAPRNSFSSNHDRQGDSGLSSDMTVTVQGTERAWDYGWFGSVVRLHIITHEACDAWREAWRDWTQGRGS
jgi:hypothetical protein